MNMQVTDWPSHYKAVKSRIANAGSPAIESAQQAPQYRTLYSEPIGPPLFRDWIYVTNFKTPFEVIRDEVLEKHGVTVQQFLGRSARHNLAAARREVWYRATKETKLSIAHIGRLTGGRDHSTVLYGLHRYTAETTGVEHPRIVKNRESARERGCHRWRHDARAAAACAEG